MSLKVKVACQAEGEKRESICRCLKHEIVI